MSNHDLMQEDYDSDDYDDYDDFSDSGDDTDDDEQPEPSHLNTDPRYIELSNHEWPGYFKQIDNRLYNSDQYPSPYPLPVDGLELNRYKLSHIILKRLLGRNYVGPVPDVLAPSTDEEKRALDLCNGGGKWVVEMCEEFPHVRFEGFDIMPNATRYPPDNALFVLEDVNKPLDYDGETFDLVHARDIAMVIQDYEILVEEIARVLKPGGLFLSVEWDRRPSFPVGDPRHLEIDAPASVRFHEAVDDALSAVGLHPSSSRCSEVLGASPFFNNVQRHALSVPITPIGGSHENQQLGRIGGWVRRSQVKLAQACKRLLVLHSGLDPEEVEEITRDYIQELRHVNGLAATFYVAYGTRDPSVGIESAAEDL